MDMRGGEKREEVFSPLKTGGEHRMNRLHIARLHMRDHQLFLIQCMTASPSINSYQAGQQYIKFLKCLFSCLSLQTIT